MKKIITICIVALLLSLCYRPVRAASDFMLWTKAGLTYRITKKFRFEFDQYTRFSGNAHYIYYIAPQVYFRYRVFNFFRIGAGYRFIAQPLIRDGQTVFDKGHRFFGNVQFRYNTKRLSWRYRLQFQEQINQRPRKKDSVKFVQTLRNKLAIMIDLPKKFEPFVSGEVYIRFKDPDGYLHKWRATTGLNYGYKANTFTIYIRGEGFLDGSDNNRAILGLGYHHTF